MTSNPVRCGEKFSTLANFNINDFFMEKYTTNSVKLLPFTNPGDRIQDGGAGYKSSVFLSAGLKETLFNHLPHCLHKNPPCSS